MYDEATATLGGDVKEPIAKPPSREEKVAAWRTEHEAAYKSACNNERCTCTPTRAEALLMQQWNNPPVD